MHFFNSVKKEDNQILALSSTMIGACAYTFFLICTKHVYWLYMEVRMHISTTDPPSKKKKFYRLNVCNSIRRNRWIFVRTRTTYTQYIIYRWIFLFYPINFLEDWESQKNIAVNLTGNKSNFQKYQEYIYKLNVKPLT